MAGVEFNEKTQMWDIKVNPKLTLSIYKPSWGEPVEKAGSSPIDAFMEYDGNSKDDVAFKFMKLHKLTNPEIYKDLDWSASRKAGEEYILTEGFYESGRSKRWDRKFTHELTIKQLQKVLRDKVIKSKVFEKQEAQYEKDSEESRQYENDLNVRNILVKPIYVAYQFAAALPKAIKEMSHHVDSINKGIGRGDYEYLSENLGVDTTAVSCDILGKGQLDFKKNAFVYKSFCENFIKSFSKLAEDTKLDIIKLGLDRELLNIFELVDERFEEGRNRFTCLNQLDIHAFLDFDVEAFHQYLIEYQTRFASTEIDVSSMVSKYKMHGVELDQPSTTKPVKHVNRCLDVTGYKYYEIEKFFHQWNLLENIKLSLDMDIRYNNWRNGWNAGCGFNSFIRASELVKALRPIIDSDVASSKLDAYDIKWRA